MEAEPTLDQLERKLEEEETLYGELLAALDRLSANPAPYDRDPGLPEVLSRLNRAEVLTPEEPEARPAGGLRGLLRRGLRKLLEPELRFLERSILQQRRFDSELVDFLNRLSQNANDAGARSAEFASALVGFAQRIDRIADAKDRLYASAGNRRCDLLLQAMDKRLESVRLGIERLSERVEGMSSAVALARAEVSAFAGGDTASADLPARRERLEEARYLAFEDRFRGSTEEVRGKLRRYLDEFVDRGPVLDLGCGRGEFLELLREKGIEAMGVDGNRDMVRVCREKGLKAELADVVEFVAAAGSASAGGIFSAQLVEHLPPRLLGSFLQGCHRVLRPGGRLILETVNPRSLVALVESFFRDLTHEKPLHPQTLEFALRAAGFGSVEIRYGSPIPERSRLLPVSGTDGDLRALNHNFEKLNAFLYGDQDYAAVALRE